MKKQPKKRRTISERTKKSLIYSAVIVGVILVSLLIAFGVNALITAIEKNDCPHPYSDVVKKYSEKYEVDENLIYAVIRVESNFDAKAESEKGAIGLMQIMPVAYKDYCIDTGEDYDVSMLKDPETNIRVGTYLLARLYRYYGNWDTVLAAYNAGIGTVSEWLRDERYSSGDGILFEIPYRQTKLYVEKVNRYKGVYDILY